MAQKIKQGSLFGRIGSGIGQGLAEQMPKSMERGRLAAGLEQLGKQKGNTPFQNFAGLVGVTGGEHPQVIQTGGELLRQQSILDRISNQEKQPDETEPIKNPYKTKENIPSFSPEYKAEDRVPVSATTTGSTDANLNPYIPPSGEKQEKNAEQRMLREPHKYPNMESARQAEQAEVAGNILESDSRIKKGELEEKVQGRTEDKITKAIAPHSPGLPDKLVTSLHQKAMNDVVSKRLTADQAAIKYKKEAEEIARKFFDMRSLGGMGLLAKNSGEVTTSLKDISRDAKEKGYRREAADELVASGVCGPQVAYAQIYPVKEIPKLNDTLKSLENISPRMEKTPGVPGIGGMRRPGNISAYDATRKTLEIAPALAESMGLEGSPLAIGYELERKGYDSAKWRSWLSDHQKDYNLSDEQKSELSKTPPGFFGQMNDFFFRAFTGVE